MMIVLYNSAKRGLGISMDWLYIKAIDY